MIMINNFDKIAFNTAELLKSVSLFHDLQQIY